MRIYVAGPMAGIPDHNFPAFHAAAAHLRAAGNEVVNPAEINQDGGEWADCMRKDIPELLKCDTIYLLPGWRDSRGAMLEMTIAKALGMRVILQVTREPGRATL